MIERRIAWHLVLAVAAAVCPRSLLADETETAPTRIALGSCCKQDLPQPIWDSIVAARPDLFLFIGDNIYGDSEDLDVLRSKWNMLLAQPGYQRLKQICPLLAVWDDHDYGANDAGAEYPRKRESQQLFLDVFDEPADSPRRTQEGIYAAYYYGPPEQRVQIILLDTRYFRGGLVKSKLAAEPGEGVRGMYVPNSDPSTTMLGRQQWDWLARQLQQPARLRIIASSIQVVAEQHGWEKWGNFPHERRRLFELIRQCRAGGVVFVSGDRHHAEISRLDGAVGYPLYDLTSSSLNLPSFDKTVAGTRWHNELNDHRLGMIYFDTNFGLIDVDFRQPDPVVRMQIRDEQGAVVLQARTTLSRLQPLPVARRD